MEERCARFVQKNCGSRSIMLRGAVLTRAHNMTPRSTNGIPVLKEDPFVRLIHAVSICSLTTPLATLPALTFAVSSKSQTILLMCRDLNIRVACGPLYWRYLF